MNAILLITALTAIMWYIIDNLKENLWGQLSYSRLITIAVSAIGGFALSFGYGLDIVSALGLAEMLSPIGQIITALTMMGGSALVSEIVEMFRNKI